MKKILGCDLMPGMTVKLMNEQGGQKGTEEWHLLHQVVGDTNVDMILDRPGIMATVLCEPHKDFCALDVEAFGPYEPDDEFEVQDLPMPEALEWTQVDTFAECFSYQDRDNELYEALWKWLNECSEPYSMTTPAGELYESKGEWVTQECNSRVKDAWASLEVWMQQAMINSAELEELAW